MTDQSTIISGHTFAQMEGSCYCCGKRGQISSRCPDKSKHKSEWAAKKTKEVIHAQKVLNKATAYNETVGSANLPNL